MLPYSGFGWAGGEGALGREIMNERTEEESERDGYDN